jgi:hypothetical protein
MNNIDISMLVLSCDKYKDLWEDFFNLREKYWPNCPYKWYVVTESEDFEHNGVEVITCGKEMNWAGRYRKAVQYVKTPYIGVFLDDFFISETIDNELISYLIDQMKEHHITYINMSNVYKSIIGMTEKEYFADHLIRIPNHQRYGISTEAAIWDRTYLLQKLGDGDYSAWQFEIDRCKEAETEKGLGGLLLCDDRMPFHVSIIPVVIQGMFYPDTIKEFKKKGYTINVGSREVMPLNKVWSYKLKVYFSTVKRGRTQLRWLASHLLGMKFFAE